MTLNDVASPPHDNNEVSTSPKTKHSLWWRLKQKASFGWSPESSQRYQSISPLEGDEEEFKNKYNPLDWFICIPSHIRHYKWWKIHVREEHERFQTLESPPADSSGTQFADGINVKLLTEHYHMQIDLYEKYLDLLIRFNFLDFAITGAILSFSLQYIDRGLISWAFAFPVFMNLFFGIMLLMAFRSLKVINREIVYMSRFLGFQPPGVRTLRHVLAINFITLVLIVLMLLPTTFNLYMLHTYNVNVNWRRMHSQQTSQTSDANKN